MAHIRITRGLDIPILGKPAGEPQPLIGSGEAAPLKPKRIALDLRPFGELKFKLLVKVGDVVKIGQPLIEDKSCPGRMFCSPAGGVIAEEKRGLKRLLLEIIIDVAEQEERHRHQRLDVDQATAEELQAYLLQAGMFSKIRMRPFNLLADPARSPKAIFVKAIESAPLVPPAEMQVQGKEEEFQAGLNALAKLTSGPVHLVYRQGSRCQAFTGARQVQKHTAEGPHPIGTPSVHIQALHPIRSATDIVWTLSAHDVVAIGYLLLHKEYLVERVVSIAGTGVIPERTGYFKAREGMPISALISGRIAMEPEQRLISGDPLMGRKVESDGFLGFHHYALTIFPENNDREFLHFFRLGASKYSFSKAYLSGHLTGREYPFTTSQHGERRAFVDASLYDQVMALPISTMLLVKAVMAEDYERAERLGLLSVDSEDFALATFVCPSKMEMTEIMKQGIRQYAQEVLA